MSATRIYSQAAQKRGRGQLPCDIFKKRGHRQMVPFQISTIDTFGYLPLQLYNMILTKNNPTKFVKYLGRPEVTNLFFGRRHTTNKIYLTRRQSLEKHTFLIKKAVSKP